MLLAQPIVSPDTDRSAVKDHILQKGFPCPIAQAMARNDTLRIEHFSTMHQDAVAVYDAVGRWLHASKTNRFRSFVAMFDDQNSRTMEEDHIALWQCLSAMRACEPANREIYEGTSDDIESPDFAFSIHGQAFFVVGLSPHSPRLSRRMPISGFALNPHQQFEDLRASGALEAVKESSRARDMIFQGSTNPLLADHGQTSAALQYSGHSVQDTSGCPYKGHVRR